MNERRRRVVLLALALGLAALAIGLARQRGRSSAEGTAAVAQPTRALSVAAQATSGNEVEAVAGSGRQALEAATRLRVEGRVLTTAGVPVAGVHVHAWCGERGGRRSALGQATSDVEGRYRIEADLAPLGLVAARLAWIELIAAAEAHGVADRKHLVDELVPGTLELDLALDSGALFVGRVVDEDGAPVRGARVACVRDTSDSVEPDGMLAIGYGSSSLDEFAASVLNSLPLGDRAELAQDRTGSDGGFALRSSSPGRLRVTARLDGRGSAAGPWVADASGRHDLGDLVLRGPGRLAGSLRDTDGAPVGGVELVALPPALAAAPATAPEVTDWRLAHEAGVGLVVGRTTTEEDGSFELAGLAAGAYWIRSGRSELALEPVARPFATGEEEIELVLATRVLALRFVDEAGLGIGSVQVQCGRVGRQGPDGVPRFADVRERSTDPDGRVEFTLAPNSESVGVFAAHPLHGSVDLELTLGRARVERELALSARSEPASLRVRIRGDLEEVLPWYRVELLAERTGATAVSYRILPRSNERESSLPPGRYRLRLAPEGVYFGAGDQVPFLAAETVVLVADEETLIELEPRHGGRIEVQYLDDGRAENAVENSEGLRFVLSDGASTPLSLHFIEVRRGARLMRGRRESLIPGDVGLSAPHQPGLYTLQATADGQLVDTRSVAVVAGVVARVVLER